MRTTSAQNFNGNDLGKQVAIEIETPEGKRRYARGRMAEWTGVWSSEPNEAGRDRMFRAILETEDGKGRAQVILAQDSILWVQDNPSQPLPKDEWVGA